MLLIWQKVLLALDCCNKHPSICIHFQFQLKGEFTLMLICRQKFINHSCRTEIHFYNKTVIVILKFHLKLFALWHKFMFNHFSTKGNYNQFLCYNPILCQFWRAVAPNFQSKSWKCYVSSMNIIIIMLVNFV